MFLIHRVIFLWHYGFAPTYIDHIDMDKLNNKIENLRPATKSQNGFNRCKPVHNKSGYKGVSWNKERQKWDAEITFNKQRIRLGRFSDVKRAAQAYAEAAARYHGEFARV